ncbi:kinase inhibitor [Leptospira perolatii]|uniref:Kinase inhibitor n=1 Tax=Leptospira perolatii TaxID=2023191 RepID=A0A2M9ZQG4_9LEPT|nr:YbhB/YbcL family Raf kinase inhibitor-like protein [Leptospira perolatii]PJZ70448.1 kinase inhibitor [Leptospira perolatii]PJZ74284.1 kinase inhibitor [Leptospira perolatii]
MRSNLKAFGLFLFSLVLTGSIYAGDLKLSSTTIKEGSKISNSQVFNGFGCTGDNISPDLQWTGAPKDTKFFAVTMYDPDAPTGSGWWHWTVFNLPADTKGLALKAGTDPNQLPAGTVQGRTDFGKPGYGGPCPPTGDKPHHYIFKVFALKDKVPLDQDSPPAQVGYYVNSLKLAEGTLTAKYGR